jgi:hypothetical protein
MKQPAIKKSIEFLIFLLLIAGCLVVLFPLSRQLDRALAGYRDSLLQGVEGRTGLRFSYDSLSPSIFRSIRFTNLVISDASNGSVIAEFSTVSLSLSVTALLRKDYTGAIRQVSVENGSIKVDAVRNQNTVRLLRALVLDAGSGRHSNQKKRAPSFFTGGDFTLKIKNIDVGYSDLAQDVSGHIVRGSAVLGSDGIDFDLQSKLRYDRPSLAKPGTIVAGISLKGSINRALDSGSATLVVKSLESGLFSLSRLALVTSYRSGTLFVSSVQDLEPVDVSLVWNIPEKDLTAKLECERLLPLRWIDIKNGNSQIANLKNLTLSGKAMAHFSGRDGLSYTVDMTSTVPEAFYAGADVRVALSGNASTVDVKKLAVSGANCEADFSGSVDIKRKVPEGFLSVKRLILPSGATLGGDFYFERGSKGFSCMAPSVRVNNSVFSSASLSASFRQGSIDIAFSALDSSGKISADGTITTNGNDRFLQLYAAFDSISVADLVRAGWGFSSHADPSAINRLSAQLAPFALTTEVYVTSDLKSFSFNCPRLVLASSESNGLVFLLSAKGNESGVDVSDINVRYGSYAVTGNVSVGFESSDGLILSAALNVNDIPYTLNGMYANRTLSLYGDYGLAVSAMADDFGGITGSLKVSGFPVPAGPLLLSCSLDTRFAYSPQTRWKVTIDSGTVEDVKNDLPLSTVMQFHGTADEKGLYLENLTVSDAYSTVTGYAGVGVLDDENGNRQYTAELLLENHDKTESIKISGQIRDQVMADAALGKFTLSDRYIEANVEAKACPLMRFAPGQQKDNLVTLTASVSGTPDNLMASADVSSIVYHVGNFDLDAHGKFLLEDRNFSLYDAVASWNGQVFTDIAGSCSVDEGKASINAKYSGIMGKSPITAAVAVDAVAGPKAPLNLKDLAERFTVHAKLTDLRWNTVAPAEPVEATFVHEPGITAIYAGKGDAITGFLLDDGSFTLQATGESPVRFHAEGNVVNSNLSIAVSDLHVDMPRLWPLTGRGIVVFDAGTVDGDFTISGLVNDPEFNGTLKANGVVVHAPGFLQDVYGPTSFEIVADGKTLSAMGVSLSGKEGSVSADAVAEFDRWVPASVHLLVHTLPKKPLRVDTENKYFKAKGYGSCNLDMTFTRTENIVSGDVYFERGAFAIVFSGFRNSDSGEIVYRSRDSLVDLRLHVGKKVEFRWPSDNFPVLRALIQADNPLSINIDTAHESFMVKGDAILRGGEIYYIKRSFYLRSGTIAFNENQDIFAPIISMRAEIRERDADGEPVRIILSVNKQPLTTFVPVLTSEPVKSDAELMALLGQAASGDSSRDTIIQNAAVSASDIFTRMSLFRTAENHIRDFMHLDIFSIRTLLLQNAIFGTSMQGKTDRKMTVGNYFDNTTVYMGKYLGSAIYADALMHFSYYDPKTEQKTATGQAVYGNLLLQPELGLEVTTPFCLLRWGITPESPETLFVTDNSITLSWKFSY